MIAASKPKSKWNEYLVRIGLYGEPLRVLGTATEQFPRSTAVVVATDRGEMLATVLQQLTGVLVTHSPIDDPAELVEYAQILRAATTDDLAKMEQLRSQTGDDFPAWENRLDEWNVNVELVDLEWTLDGQRLMLYVLNDRGPETTKLALQAAAAGFKHVDVLPLTANGLMASPGKSTGGGCGGGCH